MNIEERIPNLSDSELKNLHDNALRLSHSGNAAQRDTAERLIPLTSAALETRKSERAIALKEKRETAKASTTRAKRKQ